MKKSFVLVSLWRVEKWSNNFSPEILIFDCRGLSSNFFHFSQNCFESLREASISFKFSWRKKYLFDLQVLLYSLSFSWYFSRRRLLWGFACFSFPTFRVSRFKYLHSSSNHCFDFFLLFQFFEEFFYFSFKVSLAVLMYNCWINSPVLWINPAFMRWLISSISFRL